MKLPNQTSIQATLQRVTHMFPQIEQKTLLPEKMLKKE